MMFDDPYGKTAYVDVEERFAAALSGLSLHALLILMSRLLTRAGYGDVHLLGRREARGRSPEIGHELVCHAPLGGLAATVVVKVLRDTARVRHLDELSGVALRRGADAALLVAPRGISRSALAAAPLYAPRRIEALGVPEIARLMALHRVGVLPDGSPDPQFFEGLENASQRLLGFLHAEGLAGGGAGERAATRKAPARRGR